MRGGEGAWRERAAERSELTWVGSVAYLYPEGKAGGGELWCGRDMEDGPGEAVLGGLVASGLDDK